MIIHDEVIRLLAYIALAWVTVSFICAVLWCLFIWRSYRRWDKP